HGSGSLVIAVAVAGTADEDGRYDQWAHGADGTDDVREYAVAGPVLDRFGHCFREAVVDDAGPVLVDAVVASGGEEFLGSDESEGVEEVGGHDVGPAFAAVESEEGDAGSTAA